MSSNCPDISELELYSDGRLHAEGAGRIDGHVAECDSCRELLGEVRENLRLISPMRAVMSRTDTREVTGSMPEFIRDYRIIREIGRGGMGIVYEAEQPDPRRRVAIKVLHPSLGADGRIERMFRREASVLGRLRHPGIAAILEAGRTPDGRSFFAMELVSGVSLTAFAAREKLAIRARLELFKRVCDAIAYAHQRGVIHRDLKPSNILVVDDGPATNDSISVSNRATPKVLDFGLAKILESQEPDQAATMVTEEGRIQGTLPYMSPEQVRGNRMEFDVRSDVYSLGVVLHELLSGKLPYPIDRLRLAEAARTICETPPVRLSVVDPHLRGDIETIVLKALEKNPARRYSSVSALAEDIERMLADQPILARPPTLRYQLRKLVARHKGASALAATIAVMLMVFAVSMGVLYARANAHLLRALEAEQRASSEAEKARREAEVAKEVTDFLVGIFRTNDPDVAKGTTVTARHLLDRASENIKKGDTSDPLITAALLAAVGESYGSLGLYDEAVKHLGESYQIRRRVAPGTFELAETARSLGSVYEFSGNNEGAIIALREAVELLKQLRGPDDIHVIMTMRSLVSVMQKAGQLEAAEPVLRDLIARLRASPHGRNALPGALNSLGGILLSLDRYDEAAGVLREAVDIEVAAGAGETTTLARLKANLAWTLTLAKRFDDAEPIIREVIAIRRRILPPGHPDFASSALTLGVILMHRGELESAESQLRQALTARQSYLPPGDLELIEVKGYLGECLTLRKNYEEAEPLLLECHEILSKSKNASPKEVSAAALRLERHYEARGMTELARRWQALAEPR